VQSNGRGDAFLLNGRARRITSVPAAHAGVLQRTNVALSRHLGFG
jgi:hypothetical protein